LVEKKKCFEPGKKTELKSKKEMNTKERKNVCGVEHAGALDIRIRKLFHNPHKMLKPYIHEGMSVLDIGCGPGFFTLEMAGMVGKTGKVTAVDLQEGMLEIVKKKILRSGLQNTIDLHKCPNDQIGLSKQFDFILVFYMLHEVPDQSAFLKEIRTLVKQDGKVLIAEPKFHVSKKDLNRSMDLLKNIGFDVVDEPKILFSRAVLIKKTSAH
jgi:ubiquinone/menaquinone biosynthesis C-methylase UbiE